MNQSYLTTVGSCRVVLTERVGLEIHAEGFNLFNTPEFGFPNNTVGVANTGAITSSRYAWHFDVVAGGGEPALAKPPDPRTARC